MININNLDNTEKQTLKNIIFYYNPSTSLYDCYVEFNDGREFVSNFEYSSTKELKRHWSSIEDAIKVFLAKKRIYPKHTTLVWNKVLNIFELYKG
jgi:hypothetical protein